MGLTLFDLLIVVVYLIACVVFGGWVGRHQRNPADYFLANRTLPWPAVTLSIVATETSVLTFIGVPAISYSSDLTFIQIALGYILGRLLASLLLIPAYFRHKLVTAYHYLGERFGSKLRKLVSSAFLVTRLLADSVRLFATAIPLTVLLKGSGLFASLNDIAVYTISIGVIGLLTILYTYLGGIRSVIWLDAIQMVIYLGGALVAAALVSQKLAGTLDEALGSLGAMVKQRWLYIGTELDVKTFLSQPYTLFTALMGGMFVSLASHGVDQIIVQRLLTCKNQASAQKALTVSGFVILLQFLLFLWLGLLLFAFYGGQQPVALGLSRADAIFPKFIVEELPPGVSGLLLAALFAAAMSTLSSSLSSLASSSFLDLYLPRVKDKSERHLLKISRLMTILWGILLMGSALLFTRWSRGSVVEIALGIASYTHGGMLGAFLLGLLVKRSNERDAIIGFICALITMSAIITISHLAWPLYVVLGSVTAVATGWTAASIRRMNRLVVDR